MVLVLLMSVYLQQGLRWDHALAAALIVTVPGGALGWVVWRIRVRRFHARAPVGAAIEHGCGALAFGVLWTGAIFVLSWIVHPDAAFGFLRNAAVWQFIGGLIVYSGIAAAAQATRAGELLQERELAAAQAELQALRAQLNPHFLFNTLHSLTQLAHEDPDATERALEQFAELMRYVLHAGRSVAAWVAVEQELEFLRNYLALEKLRLGERLQVIEEIDPDVLELRIPALLLQPLVENAIRHGIAPRPAGGKLRLSLSVSDDRLAIEIVDDGNGSQSGHCDGSSGLGLKAVRKLLETHFPGEATLDISTQPGAGFTVHIDLPAQLSSGERE